MKVREPCLSGNQLIQSKFKVTKQELLEQITDLVGSIKDPQYNLTLSQLNIVKQQSAKIECIEKNNHISYLLTIIIKPTVPHCHLTQQIGLSIHYKLKSQLPEQWYKLLKIRIVCEEGSHNKKVEVQKIINDKERIAAAWENYDVMALIKSLCQ